MDFVSKQTWYLRWKSWRISSSSDGVWWASDFKGKVWGRIGLAGRIAWTISSLGIGDGLARSVSCWWCIRIICRWGICAWFATIRCRASSTIYTVSFDFPSIGTRSTLSSFSIPTFLFSATPFYICFPTRYSLISISAWCYFPSIANSFRWSCLSIISSFLSTATLSATALVI